MPRRSARTSAREARFARREVRADDPSLSDPPRFMRDDEVDGKRFAEPVEAEFSPVEVERGQA